MPQQHVEAIGDQVWDDLNRLYLECRTVSTTPAQVLPLLKDPEKLKNIQDPKNLIEQAKVLSKDVSDYNERLAAIHQLHSNREGNAEGPDELMAALNIGEEYHHWLNDFQSIVLPIVNEILEQFNVSEQPLEKPVQAIVIEDTQESSTKGEK